jgi:hypothetical protein
VIAAFGRSDITKIFCFVCLVENELVKTRNRTTTTHLQQAQFQILRPEEISMFPCHAIQCPENTPCEKKIKK